jgi:16S rRNA processing protein RimM
MAVPERHDGGGRELISVARVRHTQGRRGEVAAEILTDFPERFKAGAKFVLAKRGGSAAAREFLVEDVWFHKGQVILKFAGVGSISDAEQLIGDDVMIPAAERSELPSGTFYLDDLVGCRVVENGLEIGRVADWEDTGGGFLLHVARADEAGSGDEILIPFAEEICTAIEVASKRIEVRLPQGLIDLNAAVPTSGRSRGGEAGSGKE